ncbi:MAG: hypothetical protein MJ069_06405 [Salinivirgaceae bacterium]|nr:hypothetical protein [Salinivirgaceae bacterium]
MMFFVLSIMLWLFNRLNSDIVTHVNYPIQLKNVPTQKVVINNLPPEATLTVQGRGYDMLQYKWKAKPTLNIDMLRFVGELQKEETREYLLYTDRITEDIQSQLPVEMSLSRFQPDTIRLLFSNFSSKKVPVQNKVKLGFERQCQVFGDVLLMPDSVWVDGPSILLDTLQAINTKPIAITHIKKNVLQEVELQQIKNITIRQNKVTLAVPVSKFTEKILKLPVNVIDTTDKQHVRAVPSEVTVQFMVPLVEYDIVNKNDFRVEVDANNTAKMHSLQQAVDMVRSPEGVYNVSITPAVVDLIIERQDDNSWNNRRNR